MGIPTPEITHGPSLPAALILTTGPTPRFQLGESEVSAAPGARGHYRTGRRRRKGRRSSRHRFTMVPATQRAGTKATTAAACFVSARGTPIRVGSIGPQRRGSSTWTRIRKLQSTVMSTTRTCLAPHWPRAFTRRSARSCHSLTYTRPSASTRSESACCKSAYIYIYIYTYIYFYMHIYNSSV